MSEVLEAMTKIARLKDSEEDLVAYARVKETTRGYLVSYGVPLRICDMITEDLLLLGRVIGNRQAGDRDEDDFFSSINVMGIAVAKRNQEENLKAFKESS